MRYKDSKHIFLIFLITSIVGLVILSQTNLGETPKTTSFTNEISPLGSFGYFEWEPQIHRTVGNQPMSVSIGDANNDGANDIVTANSFDNTVSILLWNKTTGDWASQITKNVGIQPRSVFIGDANNDGQDDIVTANWNDNTTSILLWNTTSGNWNTQIIKSVGNFPESISIGDANNDGQNDIVVANSGSNNVSILSWNITDTSWNTQITKSVGAVPISVFIGDANNDGEYDIVTANSGANSVSIILWNVSANNWDPELALPVGNTPSDIFIEDANNDGQNDIVTANWNDNTTSILLWNISAGIWDSQITKAVGDYPESIFIEDANNDGLNDIVTANWNEDDISILLWNTTPFAWNPRTTINTGNDPRGIFIGDANNDGQNDIVTVNYQDDVKIHCWNTTSKNWDSAITEDTAIWPLDLALGDANNDGQNDLVIVRGGSTTVIDIILWNTTSGDWDPVFTRSVGGYPIRVYLGDANNDGQNDIMTVNEGDNTISVLTWNSTSGDWASPIIKSVGLYPSNGGIGDVNNDGYNDLVGANFGGTVSILLWNTSSSDWDPAFTRAIGAYPFSMFIGDANNDGQNDIVTVNNNDNNISLLLWNTTSGDWDPQITKPTGSGPSSVFIGDVNNDGQNDIVIANYDGNSITIYLWNNSINDWDPQITKSSGRRPFDLFVGDANNDGLNDIVTSDSWDDVITIYSGNLIPGITLLDPILPSTDYDGIVNLDWNDVTKATKYYVYRDNSFISTVDGLTPISMVSDSNYTDTLTINGMYYYAIVAGNDAGNSSVSNCENVTVKVPLNLPVLDPIVPAVDIDGTISLNWTDVTNVIFYYVYRDTSNISSVTGLTPIAAVADSNYTDIITTIGLYYYAIVAGDGWVNSSLSNCENVTVVIPPLLDPILPDPDADGIIHLDWSDVNGATDYYIYRNISVITDITGLTPIATISGSNHTDVILTIGTYYYVIVAGDGLVNTSISNCENVTVAIPPVLDPILPAPNADGIIDLDWNDVNGATDYYVYRNTSVITQITGMTPIATISDSNHTDLINTIGIYYYVIVAGDSLINSSISNCENITVAIPPVLDPILPDPNINGLIDLDWSDVNGATDYYIYRNTTTITQITGMTPIATVSDSNYTEILTNNELYYYVIVAGNGLINSTISNCVNITVTIPLNSSFVFPILPLVDVDGIIELEWNEVERASIYYIYRDTSYILSIDGLTPIAIESDINYTDTLTVDGYYYYVIVAGDGWVNSSVSNCQFIQVKISSGDGDEVPQDDYTLLLVLLIIAGFAIASTILIHGFLVRTRSPATPPPPKKTSPVSKKS